MSFRIGDRIGDYEVVGMLGAGGMGAVYQARHVISDRIEALKVLLPDYLSNADLAERFMREIRLQASLSHPNIAALHNALRVDNQLVMVIEFVDGETLGDMLRRGPLSQRRAVEIIAQVLSALEYAHARGIIHRDIKPSNIMITRDGVVKLMDFGIATGLRGSAQITQVGAVIGSMFYMSPEQVRAETPDGRSDIYAIGVTLFEAVTGQRPIQGTAAADVLNGHLEQIPPSARTLNPTVPETLAHAIQRALEKDRTGRYNTAGEFRHELLRILPTLPDSFAAPTVVFPVHDAPPSWATQTPRTSSAAGSFDPERLERLRKDLALHIGPMAKVLVDRAAKRSRNWQELYSLLANEIPAGKDRQKFLAGCPP